MVMRYVAVIPARGGSRGIPRKNLQVAGGLPLLSWTVRAAKAARRLDEVIVSTEDREIADLAAREGARVVPRPAHLARDDSPTEPVLEHVVEVLREAGARPEAVVLLQCTSPLRGADVIDACIDRFEQTGADAVLTACRDVGFRWEQRDGRWWALYDHSRRPRRQDIPLTVRENGAVYVTRTDLLLRAHNRLGDRNEVVLMPEEESVEVDAPYELWLVDQILRARGAGR